jgi:hypothetical protein
LLWKFVLFLHIATAALVALSVEAARADQEWPAAEDGREIDNPIPAARWDLLAEVVKQAAEQPLHFAMSAGPIWLSRYLTAVPWYGWAVAPALAYREWRQWPSQRWWDPALDAGFLVLGLVVGTWSGRTLPGPSPLAAMRRLTWLNVLMRLAPGAIRRPLRAQHATS